MRRRKVLVAAGLAFLLGLGVRCALVAGGRDLVPDGVVDLEMARDFSRGEWRAALAHRFHPLEGALACAVGRALGRAPDETCGLVVSVLAGSLVPLFVALAAARLVELSSEKRAGEAALAAGVLAAVHPYLARAGATVFAYPLAHAALAGALAATLRALATGKAGSLVLAGIACGLAYLARPDGVIVFLGVLGGVAFAPFPGKNAFFRRAAACAIVGATALAVASPYIVGLREVNGEWPRLTPKKDVRHLVGIADPNPHPESAPVASEMAALLAPPPAGDPQKKGETASAVLYALRKTADAVHPLVLALGLVGLVATRNARLAHSPLALTFLLFFVAHVLLKRNEGYLSKEHAAGEAAILLAWAGGCVLLIPFRGKDAKYAFGSALLVGAALLLPKTMEAREAEKNAVEREVARAIAERWSARKGSSPQELVVCGNEAHARSVAFLSGGRLAELRGASDAASVVSGAQAAGASFLALFARTKGEVEPKGLAEARAALARAGLGEPRIFRSKPRRDDEVGSVVYTWLLYEVPWRSN